MKYQQFSKGVLIFLTASALLFNCSKKKEEDPAPVPVVTPEPEVRKTTYTFNQEFALGGDITFTELSATQTKVDLIVKGASANTHPARIYKNSAAETGDTYKDLTSVDATGKSTTVLDVDYNTLVNYDGHINVLENILNPTIIAQSDIGGNLLTGKSQPYTISPVTGSSVGGTVLFKERKNGNTLAIVTLTSVSPGQQYGVFLNSGKASSISLPSTDVELNDVDGTKRVSETNIKFLKGTNNSIKYQNILDDPRYILITASDKTTELAKGDIGSNVK